LRARQARLEAIGAKYEQEAKLAIVYSQAADALRAELAKEVERGNWRALLANQAISVPVTLLTGILLTLLVQAIHR
jgi:hypothetical protein